METDGNYARIVADNLVRLYGKLPENLEGRLGAVRRGNDFSFEAFGEACRITPDGIRLGDRPESGVCGILISLYALHAGEAPCLLEPFKGFKELPDSMPYTGAFAARTQQVLVPHLPDIERHRGRIMDRFSGRDTPPGTGGDIGFVLYPVPKIALCYLFYRADEDFPASTTCLYSNNAPAHLPTDALADVGEYTSRAILRLLGK
jgi:hypothetical protein